MPLPADADNFLRYYKARRALADAICDYHWIPRDENCDEAIQRILDVFEGEFAEAVRNMPPWERECIPDEPDYRYRWSMLCRNLSGQPFKDRKDLHPLDYPWNLLYPGRTE